MSIWLFTLRNHKTKPTLTIKGHEIPVFHYVFCKSHATSSWQTDIDKKNNYKHKAKSIFYSIQKKYYFCERKWKDVWYEEFGEIHPQYAKGILVSLRKRKGKIYYQNYPRHTWYDCDPISGIEVGEFVKGKVVLNEQGKEIVSKMITHSQIH